VSLEQQAFALDVANVLLAILFGARVMLALKGRGVALLVALLSVAAVAHVVLGRDDYGGWIAEPFQVHSGTWRPVLNLARNTAPALFMLLVHRLFTDDRRPPPWLWALVALQLVLEEPFGLLAPVTGRWGWILGELTPSLLQTLFAGVAVYWTVAYWRVDLVEARRRTRAVVLLVLSVDVVASSLLLRVLIPADSAANYDAHVALGVANLALIGALLLWLTGGEAADYLEVQPRRAVPPRAGAGEAADLARLRALIEDEHLYREPRLSLKGLADRAGLPEYRLRRLIHEALGFRNFNAFLHHYRIAEACARLADPSQRRTPVLTIALSVGYQSVNTFNRGFREVTGMTPTDYRADPAAVAGGAIPTPKAE
jgi:AraC-like DNA-binding protein